MSGLAAIQASLRKLQNLGQATSEFDIPAFNMRVKIRLLYPGEEHVVHAIADAAPDETMPYLDTYHWESVSRVLMAVWMDGKAIFDFTDVSRMSQNHDREMIEVVVEKEGGQEEAKWIEKASLLKPVLRSWGRDMLNIIFKKYRELSDDQTVRTRQGVEFKFSSIDDEIRIMEARIRVLKSRQEDAKVVERAVATFSNIVQRPLNPDETESVEESLDVRDMREDPPSGAESKPKPEPEPEPTMESELEDLEVAQEPAGEDEPLLAPLPRTRPKTIVQDGQEVAVHQLDGGVLEKHDAPVTAPPLNSPPVVGHNSQFTGGGGQRVRDRSQRG